MFVFKSSLKRANPFAPYEDENGVKHPRIPPELLTEVEEPTPPADYSEDTYRVFMQDSAPYVVYVKKSDDEIAWATNDKIQANIEAAEKQALLPRVIREFLLAQPAANTKPWFNTVKDLDTAVATLRKSKVPEKPRPVDVDLDLGKLP